MINQAIMFATACHANQTRKATNTPYILHPMEAATIAASLSTKDGQVDQEVICAAILHDLCEDAFITIKVIEEMFGEKVAKLVEFQTEDKSKSWDERKEHTIDTMRLTSDKNKQIVILADKLSNMRSISRDYKEFGEELWNRFNEKDKNKHKWYYKSIYECLGQLKHTPEYKEYEILVHEVFASR